MKQSNTPRAIFLAEKKRYLIPLIGMFFLLKNTSGEVNVYGKASLAVVIGHLLSFYLFVAGLLWMLKGI